MMRRARLANMAAALLAHEAIVAEFHEAAEAYIIANEGFSNRELRERHNARYEQEMQARTR